MAIMTALLSALKRLWAWLTAYPTCPDCKGRLGDNPSCKHCRDAADQWV